LKQSIFLFLISLGLCNIAFAQCPFEGSGFDEIRPLKNGRSLVRKGVKWGYADENNKIAIPLQYDIAHSFDDSTALVGKYDRTRSDTITYYDSQLDNDVTEIRFGIKYNLINTAGKTVLSLSDYQDVKPFSDGLGLVGYKMRHPELRNQLLVTYGIINTKGKFVQAIQYIGVGEMSEKAFAITQNDKMGLMNCNGDTIVAPIYDDIKPFSCGLALVLCANGHYNYINHEGKKLLPEDAWEATEFKENRAFVRLDYLSKWASLIDTAGTAIKLVGFQKHNDFSEGVCAVWSRPDYLQTETKAATFINLNGETANIGAFDEVGDFCNGFARVSADKKVFYIDKTGKKASCD
jgi:WG containing repeat